MSRCVFNSKRFAEIYEKNMDVSHKKLKHQHRGVTAVNCDGHSMAPGSVTSFRETVYSIQSDSLKYMKKHYGCIASTPWRNSSEL